MSDETIPMEEWVWCGYPGHFAGASDCRMHLHTRVGDYRISTLGDYRPRDGSGPERLGVGEDSFYETFVFEVEGHGSHGEGVVVDFCGIDSERYATSEAAERGHFRLCRKYASLA